MIMQRSARPFRLFALIVSTRGARLAAGVAALGVLAVAKPAIAQQPDAGKATITGVVKDGISGAPIPGVVVNIPGTTFQSMTDDQGRYTLRNVPQGNQTIDARRVGYSQVHDVNVRVNAAQFTHDMTMSQVALSLQAITTSATVDPTSGTKAPFAIATLTTEHIPIPTTGVTTNLQGKVAGLQVTRSSGSTGGEEPWVQIRSIQSPGNRGATPLIIVDGVPLNMVRQTNSGTTVSTSGAVGAIVGTGDAIPVRSTDIQGLDIESIEIIKGAAAAALYGSEAASGVISIKTKRGTDIGLGKSRVEVRTDYGFDQIVKMPEQRQHHQFLVNAQGQWVDLAGTVVTRPNRVIDPDQMLDNNYAVIYNPVKQVFQSNRTMNSTVRMSHMAERSNFQASYTRTRQPGILRDAYGSTNQSLRVNVDHRPRDNVELAVGANYSNFNDVPTAANFVQLFGFDPDVNLLAPGDQFGTRYKIVPDSATPTILNPLYLQSISGNSGKRTATQLSANVSYRPLNWLTVNGNLGYNRQEGTTQVFQPPGLPSDEAGGLTTGNLSYTEQLGDGIAGHASATVLRDIGKMTARLTGQAETSKRHFVQFQASGQNYPTIGSQTLTAANLKDASSFQTEARLNAGFGRLAIDYDGRYIGDFLLRREGSSLYGPRSRYSTFARASGAWLMSREGWWPEMLRDFTLAKVRYSYGTSGTEPDFNDQFEAVSVTNTGFVRGRLGNRGLLPETKHEHEMGVDLIWNNRASLTLTYARSQTTNGIMEVDAPNITGFNTYTRNAAEAHGNAIEASLEGLVLQRSNFRWSTLLNVDRAKSYLDTYGRSCYSNTPQFVRICAGVPITQYWGSVVMRSKDQLAKSRSGTPGAWEVNDEGYLVPVGVGNHWYEGMQKRLWGTTVVIDGITYNWGVPQPAWDDSAATVRYAPIGDWTPTFNYGFGNRFSYRNLQLYVLLTGVAGGQIVNGYREWLEQNLDARAVDQTGRPDSLKKPYLYYLNLPGGGKTTGLTAQNGTTTKNNDQYVESASFIKLAEVQLSYSFDAKRFSALNRLGAERMTLELNGTNLLRWDGGYKGLDQEGFYTLSDHQRIKFDGMRYPLARRFTTAVTLVF
jgi:TonB-linked SusC/RagA family outer membrane protein